MLCLCGLPGGESGSEQERDCWIKDSWKFL